MNFDLYFTISNVYVFDCIWGGHKWRERSKVMHVHKGGKEENKKVFCFIK